MIFSLLPDRFCSTSAQALCYEGLRDALHVIALAGGSGITPFLSMAYAIRDGMEDFDLTILYGSRTKESILFRDELNAIAGVCPRVKVIHVLSEEACEGFEHGFLTADLIRKYAPAGEYSVFLCGPEGVYRFVLPEVEKLGLPRRRVRCEAMGVTKAVWEQEGYPAECRDRVFRVMVRQGASEQTVQASANEPVLVALERAGIAVPSRCRSGECGWCRSKLGVRAGLRPGGKRGAPPGRHGPWLYPPLLHLRPVRPDHRSAGGVSGMTEKG